MQQSELAAPSRAVITGRPAQSATLGAGAMVTALVCLDLILWGMLVPVGALRFFV